MQFIQQLINGLTLGAIYALIALGYTMVYGVMRLINFAHGDVYMLGAYAGLFAAGWFGVNRTLESGATPGFLAISLVFLASMAICALVGIIIERFAYRPLRNSSRLAALITAIGVSMFIEYGGQAAFSPDPRQFPAIIPHANVNAYVTLAHVLWAIIIIILGWVLTRTKIGHAIREGMRSPVPSSFLGISADKISCFVGIVISTLIALFLAFGISKIVPYVVLFRTSDYNISRAQVLIVGVAFALMMGLQIIITQTKIGRAMRAVSHDRVAASLMGINTDAVISFTFALGSALAAAGGVLNSLYTPKIDPLIGLMIGIKAFVAAVLGGIGSIPGAVLGALLLGFAETATVAAGKSEYRDAIAFAILIGVLLIRPTGLLGKTKAEKV